MPSESATPTIDLPSTSAPPTPGENNAATATLDDAELELFVDGQIYISGVHLRQIGGIPPTELNRLLGHFYCKVRKNDNTLYEPNTLTSFQRSLARHLTKTFTSLTAL